MQFLKILTPVLVATIVAASVPSTALAQGANDSVLTEMAQAFRKGDRKKLAQLLPRPGAMCWSRGPPTGS